MESGEEEIKSISWVVTWTANQKPTGHGHRADLWTERATAASNTFCRSTDHTDHWRGRPRGLRGSEKRPGYERWIWESFGIKQQGWS